MTAVLLPIFPLPLVLFPGAVQPLHIFEPRYRQLLADCLAGERRFGISPVGSAAPDGDPTPQPGEAGCVALVRSCQPLPDGRSNIVTVGAERYVLRGYLERELPYRLGAVELFDDEDAEEPATAEATALLQRVRARFLQVESAADALNDAPARMPDVSAKPRAFSFHVAAAVELDLRLKQALLAVRSTWTRLRVLERVLDSVAEDLGRRAEVHRAAKRNGTGLPGRSGDIE